MAKVNEQKTREDIEDKETEEQLKEEMKEGELDEDVYSDEGTKLLVDDDEITDLEEGFMEGYREASHGKGHLAKCSQCGRIVTDKFVEIQKEHDVFRFCS